MFSVAMCGLIIFHRYCPKLRFNLLIFRVRAAECNGADVGLLGGLPSWCHRLEPSSSGDPLRTSPTQGQEETPWICHLLTDVFWNLDVQPLAAVSPSASLNIKDSSLSLAVATCCCVVFTQLHSLSSLLAAFTLVPCPVALNPASIVGW